jgi:hypothetical protein
MPIRSSTSDAMSTSAGLKPEKLAPFVAGQPVGMEELSQLKFTGLRFELQG